MSQRIVGIADLYVSADTSETLVTYSLGSCIGLAIYDPQARVGGMLHYMLPDSSLDSNRAASTPAMFADTGIRLLFEKALSSGLTKKRTRIVVAGAAEIMDESGFFNIGKRNYDALQKIFTNDGVSIDAEDVGGHMNRTLYLEISTGRILIKIAGREVREL